jgi:hypothetical protein
MQRRCFVASTRFRRRRRTSLPSLCCLVYRALRIAPRCCTIFACVGMCCLPSKPGWACVVRGFLLARSVFSTQHFSKFASQPRLAIVSLVSVVCHRRRRFTAVFLCVLVCAWPVQTSGDEDLTRPSGLSLLGEGDELMTQNPVLRHASMDGSASAGSSVVHRSSSSGSVSGAAVSASASVSASRSGSASAVVIAPTAPVAAAAGGSRSARSSSLQCNVCFQQLSRMDALRRHLKIHSGEKPYTCRHCGWAFTQKVRTLLVTWVFFSSIPHFALAARFSALVCRARAREI